MGDLLCTQKSYKGKIYFEPCFQLFKKNELGQLEKRQQFELGEKEGEAISAIRNTVIHDAENLGLVPILELTSDKESTMDQELANCNKVYDIATFNRSRSAILTNLLTFRFDCSPQKRMSNETSSCLCQLYFERFQRTDPNFGRLYVC